jgi:hypothetical protein
VGEGEAVVVAAGSVEVGRAVGSSAAVGCAGVILDVEGWGACWGTAALPQAERASARTRKRGRRDCLETIKRLLKCQVETNKLFFMIRESREVRY